MANASNSQEYTFMDIPANRSTINHELVDMIVKRRLSCPISTWLLRLFSTAAGAQKQGSMDTRALFQRLQIAPERVFKMFREAKIQPVDRVLTVYQSDGNAS
ncbi:hypothetical protein GCM10028818_52890 [Spirosoma horti]